jgi:hypothetical protein
MAKSDSPKSLAELAEYDEPVGPAMNVPGMPEVSGGGRAVKRRAAPRTTRRLAPSPAQLPPDDPLAVEAPLDAGVTEEATAPSLSRPEIRPELPGPPPTGTLSPDKRTRGITAPGGKDFRAILQDMVQEYDLCPSWEPSEEGGDYYATMDRLRHEGRKK